MMKKNISSPFLRKLLSGSKNISEIVEFMPNVPDYDNAKCGIIKIIMTNGDEYYAMDWSIDEILQLIERAS